MDAIGAGALRLVVVSGHEDLIAVLREHVRADDIRRIAPNAAVVYTDVDNATIRDRVRAHSDGGSVMVVEFERWSAFGDVDAEWLLRRGH